MPRVLITGSRTWDNRDIMFGALKAVYRDLKGTEPVILVSGHAKGADLLAEQIWAEKVNENWIETYPAKDFSHPLRRNDHMISLGADICLAFLLPCYKPGCQVRDAFHFSHGGAYTADHAKEAGIDTRIIEDHTKPPF